MAAAAARPLAKVHALTAPHPQHVAAVHAFLAEHGVSGEAATLSSDFIVALVPVEKAEAMLVHPGSDDKYQELRHAGSGQRIHRLRSKGYSLPVAVAAAVDLVAPATHVPTARFATDRGIQQPRGLFNTPKSLRALYGVGTTLGNLSSVKQAVTGFLNQKYSQSSLQSFYRDFCGKSTGFSCGEGNDASKVRCVGDACAGIAGTESMLDIEYITALGANVKTEFWGFSGNNPYNKQQEPFMKWLYTVGNTSDADVPKLFSTSYGEDETSVPVAWQTRTNNEFIKCAARGISLLFASGDSGAAGDNGCAGPNSDIFVPQWPSGSPYVTAVGGASGGSPTSPESVAGLSSGGFSNKWGRPAWQKDATAAYLNGGTKLPDKSHYNSTGRGFPDIAAQAVNFVIVSVGGIPLPGVSGTSCASPTAAGIFGLLNDIRGSAGKAPLGFLNPFIYQNAAAFNDITKGSNNGCGFSSPGFPAAKGWDAATGLGSPNFPALKAAVEKLP